MFRQVKFVIRRTADSPLFTLETRSEIEDKILDLLLAVEHDENIMDIPSLVTDRLTPRQESTATKYNIVAANVNKDLDLEEIKQKLNRKLRRNNMTVNYEVLGGKRRSSKRRTSGGKRRSSQRRRV
jgi:hypothetical protein